MIPVLVGPSASWTGERPVGDPLTTGFVFAIEDALKWQLEGMSCSNRKGENLPVEVYFAYPEQERRQLNPPTVTIQLLSIQPAYGRMHSMNTVGLPYEPDVGPMIGDGLLSTRFPIPLDMTYSIQSYCRAAMQDREVVIQMSHPARMPLRHGGLPVADGTIREMRLISGPTSNDFVDDQQNRVFRKTWQVAISEEVLIDQIPDLATVPVSSVHVTLRDLLTNAVL